MLGALLTAPIDRAPCESVGAWWPRHRAIAGEHPDTIHQAIAGGFAADRTGWAFASGYQAALHALFPDVPGDRICALCVTETEGNSPKAIKSALRKHGDHWLLNGAKRWTTLGPDGALFFVAARDEAASGERPSIKIVRVSSGSPGLQIQVMPETKFVPEVPHAQLEFENLKIAEAAVLPGDGYANYVKPFRTVEDIHVNAAIVAYLLREGRRLGWPESWLERTVSLLVLLQELSKANPSAPETHIVLSGALAVSGGLTGETDAFWKAAAPDPAADRWRRDKELLKVAGGFRAQRTQRAWENLKQAGSPVFPCGP